MMCDVSRFRAPGKASVTKHHIGSLPWPNRSGVSRPRSRHRRRSPQGKYPRSNWGRVQSAGSSVTMRRPMRSACATSLARWPRRAPPTQPLAPRTKAAARHPHDGEGILQHRRPADDLRHSRTEGFHADRGRTLDRAGQGCRRSDLRQDECAARPRRLAEP